MQVHLMAADMTAAPRWASLTRMDLGLSLMAPIGWEVTGDEARLRLLGPESGGRRPTFTVLRGEPEGQGEEWFGTFRRQAVEQMQRTVPGYQMISQSDFVLSSWVDVTAVYYRRDDPRAGAVSQLQAYLWASSALMYVVDAATGRAREDVDLPIFDALLHSVRVLPAS